MGLGDPDARAGRLRLRPGGVRLPRHGPGDHRRRLLRPGHRQRAVGLRAVADRGRSPASSRRSRRTYGFEVNFDVAKDLLEENDGAGNTFKATAKPVLIGTAVVGATTMIFAIIMALTEGLTDQSHRQAVDPAPAVPARAHHRRRDDLLVHRRLDAGRHHRRLPRGRVHQGQHQARRRRPRPRSRTARRWSRSARSLRAEGDVQHLPRRLLLHPGLRVRRAVLLHRLPDLDRALRPLPGHLHGQRRRRVGQRQEDRRDRAEGEGHRRCTRPRSSATPSAIRSRTPRRWP